jgi:mono/diheme cytochrome c family protein
MTQHLVIGRSALLVVACVLVFGLTVSTQAGSGRSNQNGKGGKSRTDDHPRFPPGEGRDVTLRVCSQCHSVDSAADKKLDADGWQDLVSWMMQIGAEINPKEFDQIVRYLSNAFPPRK